MKKKILSALMVLPFLFACGQEPGPADNGGGQETGGGQGTGGDNTPTYTNVQDLMDPTKAVLPNTGDYYGSITATKGQALRDQLHSRITLSSAPVSYDGLWNVYKVADLRPDGTIWDIYGDFSYRKGLDQLGNYSKEGDGYNREHTIPKSWFGEGSPMVSDAFHVLPTDGKINGIRSNYPYGEVGANPTYTYSFDNYLTGVNKLGYSSFSGYTGTVFEPADCYKGDIARIYFYFVTCYYNKNISQAEGSTVFSSLTNNTEKLYGLTTYAKKLFLKWHKQDPVSQKEINRNNEVYKFQHNRNPFVDHPDYVSAIWEDGEAVIPSGTPVLDVYKGDGVNIQNEQKLTTDTVTLTKNQTISLVAYVDGERQAEGSNVTHSTPNETIVTVGKYYNVNVRLTAKANGTTFITFYKNYLEAGVQKTVSKKINIVVTGCDSEGTSGGEVEGGGGGGTQQEVTGTDFKFTTTSPTTMGDDNNAGVTPTITGNTTNVDDRGIQFTKDGQITIPKINTTKKIGKVTVVASSNKATYSMCVKVGNTQFGSSVTLSKTSDKTYTFTATAVANDIVYVVLTTSSSTWVKSITITFVD